MQWKGNRNTSDIFLVFSPYRRNRCELLLNVSPCGRFVSDMEQDLWMIIKL